MKDSGIVGLYILGSHLAFVDLGSGINVYVHVVVTVICSVMLVKYYGCHLANYQSDKLDIHLVFIVQCPQTPPLFGYLETLRWIS